MTIFGSENVLSCDYQDLVIQYAPICDLHQVHREAIFLLASLYLLWNTKMKKETGNKQWVAEWRQQMHVWPYNSKYLFLVTDMQCDTSPAASIIPIVFESVNYLRLSYLLMAGSFVLCIHACSSNHGHKSLLSFSNRHAVSQFTCRY